MAKSSDMPFEKSKQLSGAKSDAKSDAQPTGAAGGDGARNPIQHTATAEADNFVLPFHTVASNMMGRVVRLGAVADTILSRHTHPHAVSELLGQALALTAMLGSNLKFDGNLTVQTQTDGAVNLLVASYESPGRLRGYAGVTQEKLAALLSLEGEQDATIDPQALIGNGHLALTIDPGEGMERYQGIVALEGGDLATAAHGYFQQSEQLPTFVRLAVARIYEPTTDTTSDDAQHGTSSQGSVSVSAEDGWHWRVGGLIVQYVSPIGGKASEPIGGNASEDMSQQREMPLLGVDDEDWRRVEMLAATVEDHELLDPTLSPDRLLYRLFHEEGVRVFPRLPVEEFCRCSEERISSFLQTFTDQDKSDLLDEAGHITVQCEFCSSAYRFDPKTLAPIKDHA